jgi:hypothetical protein
MDELPLERAEAGAYRVGDRQQRQLLLIGVERPLHDRDLGDETGRQVGEVGRDVEVARQPGRDLPVQDAVAGGQRVGVLLVQPQRGVGLGQCRQLRLGVDLRKRKPATSAR